jgi:hypothetical protein
MEAGCCLGSEGNGVSVGEGGEGPSERGKDQQSMPKQRQGQHGDGQGRPIKSDMMEEDCREQSEQSSDQVKF